MADVDKSGVADALELSTLAHEQEKASKDYNVKMRELSTKAAMEDKKMKLEYDKLQVERENMQNDLQIARENRKGRSKSKK
jgi:hypothetical protein